MSTSLYDLSVASYLQMVASTAGVLKKGAEHCAQTGADPEELVKTSLHPTMAALDFQIVSVAHHSLGAINGITAGEFAPPGKPEATNYTGLQQMLGDTLAALQALDADTINALAGGQVNFRLGEQKMPFTNENFVLSFSLPNVYFHATTAYDILRSKGVPLGKRDFLGQLRMGV